MSVRIAIRVDASAEMGLGHVRRCLSLAEAAARRNATMVFITRRLDAPVASELSAKGWHCIELPAPTGPVTASSRDVPHAAWACVDAELDARQTIAALEGSAPDWVVVDHYSFDARWHRALRSALGARILVIDDLGDRELDADLVVDHNHAPDHRLKYGGRVAAGVPILGGPGYALLGPAYAQAPRYEFCPTVRSVGIFMGGADAGNHSALAVHAVRHLARFAEPIEIVTTRSNPHLPGLVDIAARDGATTITTELADLSGFFARHDLQVGAGGGATWERCCIGVPTLALVVADNQRSVLHPLRDLDVLALAPEVPPTAEGVAREFLRLAANPVLRRRLASNSRRLVDGQGAGRVAHYLIDSCKP